MGSPKAVEGMGFRDLSIFNLALLAKKLWRIHTRPQSLVATILRDKYFKDSNALESRVKALLLLEK